MKFSGKVGNGPLNKWLKFGNDPDLYCDTGNTCLGGDMHCVSASSLSFLFVHLSVYLNVIHNH